MPKRELKNKDKQKSPSSSSKKRKQLVAIELPEILKELKQKFEATNIYCAFCDARITSSVTLQSIQKAVPNLTCQDLAAINVIIPNFVKFNPVSVETLEIEFGRAVSKKASKEKHGHALANRGDDWADMAGLFSKKSSETTIVKPDAIKKLIEQQNKLFNKSLLDYLKQCNEKVW
jgi:DEAD/DEAH box helicase domain-containing protein